MCERSELSQIQTLVSAVSKMMLCFPKVIKEGSIDEDFTLPRLIVEEVRNALKPFEAPTDDNPPPATQEMR